MIIKQLDIQLTNESNVQMMKIKKEKFIEGVKVEFRSSWKWNGRDETYSKRRWSWRSREDEGE